MSFAHDGVELARVRGGRGGAHVLPVAMIAALVAIAFGFRIALILEKGTVGYGQLVAPLADKGPFGAMLVELLLPDRLTLAIVEALTRLL